MTITEKKLNILSKVAEVLNKNNITWAVGASLLLYFKGITHEFHDIDIMIYEGDVEKVNQILLSFGTLQPKNPNAQYKTKYFLEYNIDGVDIDIMAGFTIVCDNKEYYFPLEKNSVKNYININNVSIPLQSIEEWHTYYKLMGRVEKVKMIEDFYEN